MHCGRSRHADAKLFRVYSQVFPGVFDSLLCDHHLDFLLTTGAESYLSIGKTAAEILRLSREQKATMIVMGRNGKDWFQEYWLGGVSHRVAEISELPVLLVP
ncbi:MAG: universal stress protein [Desulfobacterales bacterium]